MPHQQDAGQHAVAAMMRADRASAALGITVTGIGSDRATATMTVRADMVNGHDIAHGGMVFALADTAFACACNSSATVTVAASAEIVFVTPARLGDELVAEAVMRTRWGRHGICDVTVRRGDDVVAEFRGRSAELNPGG
jgi:acyl-CoA thioesterase